jgi:actin-related protein 5
VGDYDSGTVKLFDFTRSSLRSAFDGNVVYQFETMESILDYTFDRIGVDGAVVSLSLDFLCPYQVCHK